MLKCLFNQKVLQFAFQLGSFGNTSYFIAIINIWDINSDSLLYY